jgi:hypothetical protein
LTSRYRKGTRRAADLTAGTLPPMRPVIVGAAIDVIFSKLMTRDLWRRKRAPPTRDFSGRYLVMEISKAEGVSDGWHAG